MRIAIGGVIAPASRVDRTFEKRALPPANHQSQENA
jgi:hypothetical protein